MREGLSYQQAMKILNGTMGRAGSSKEGMGIGASRGGRHGKITQGVPWETRGGEHRPKSKHIVRPRTREKGAWRKREGRVEKRGSTGRGKGIRASGPSSQPTEMRTSHIMQQFPHSGGMLGSTPCKTSTVALHQSTIFVTTFVTILGTTCATTFGTTATCRRDTYGGIVVL